MIHVLLGLNWYILYATIKHMLSPAPDDFPFWPPWIRIFSFSFSLIFFPIRFLVFYFLNFCFPLSLPYFIYFLIFHFRYTPCNYFHLIVLSLSFLFIYALFSFSYSLFFSILSCIFFSLIPFFSFFIFHFILCRNIYFRASFFTFPTISENPTIFLTS